MHAWAEVYLPGIGWRGYDLPAGSRYPDGHVAVAAGFDHDLACPVAGWYSGRAHSRMEASLRMHIEDLRFTSCRLSKISPSCRR